jgi:hypothetical protein
VSWWLTFTRNGEELKEVFGLHRRNAFWLARWFIPGAINQESFRWISLFSVLAFRFNLG